MTRLTRAESKARTRQHLLDEAQRLFRERGYAATSLEQIAEAAEVTKGAIYGHFSSKEDLLLSAIEAAPTPGYGAVLNDQSRPLRERLAEFGRTMAADDATTDKAGLAVSLEFAAALLRTPDALRRYSANLQRRLEDLAADDDEQPLPGPPPCKPGPSATRYPSGCRYTSASPRRSSHLQRSSAPTSCSPGSIPTTEPPGRRAAHKLPPNMRALLCLELRRVLRTDQPDQSQSGRTGPKAIGVSGRVQAAAVAERAACFRPVRLRQSPRESKDLPAPI